VTAISGELERRFVVPGRAFSFRSPRAASYKRKVRREATGALRRDPPSTELDVFIDYFHLGERRMDMDNIAKCILDALNGVAYVDDRQVRRQSSHAHDLTRRFTLSRGPVDLIKPLASHDQYVVVRVREVIHDGPPPARRTRHKHGRKRRR